MAAAESTAAASRTWTPRLRSAVNQLPERFYHNTATTPCCVSHAVLGVSFLLAVFPWLLFRERTLRIDYTLDTIVVRGVPAATRTRSLMQALSEGGQRRPRPTSKPPTKPSTANTTVMTTSTTGLMTTTTATTRTYTTSTATTVSSTVTTLPTDTPSLTVVYSAKDRGNVLTAERLKQALELERRVSELLGPPLRTALQDYFPSYPDYSGAAGGQLLDSQIHNAAEKYADSRYAGTILHWPEYDRWFTTCHPETKLISSVFPRGNPKIYTDDLPNLVTSELQLSFFENGMLGGWFGQELTQYIGRDILFLFGVIVGVFPVLIFMTNSVFIPAMGLLGILMAAGVAASMYRFFFSDWWGLMNGFSLFLLLGIGCDDIFVVFDTWRQSVEVAHLAADDYDGRLRYTMPRAGKAIMITSFTTAAAFFGNCISVIPPIRLFGLYSGIVVLCDWVLTVLFLPAVLVLHHKHLNGRPWCFCCSRSKSFSLGWTYFDGNYLNEGLVRWTKLTIRAAPVLVIAFAIIAALSVKLALDLPPGRTYHQSEVFPSYHNQVLAHEAQQLMKVPDPGYKAIMIVHGIIPTETGSSLDPTSSTDIVWDHSFDIYDPKQQAIVLDFCRNLLVDQSLVRKLQSCWAQDLKTELGALGTEFPGATKTQVDDVLRNHWPLGLFTNDEGGYFAVIYAESTMLSSEKAIVNLREEHDRWETFVQDWNAEARRRGALGVSSAFQLETGGDWMFMATIEDISKAAYTAMYVSAGCVAVMLGLLFQDLLLMALIMTHIIGLSAMLVATWTLAGRSLTVVEALALSLLIGLSVDYLTHVTAAYTEAAPGTKRSDRAMQAVKSLGRSIVGGAITTITSSFFLALCKISFFNTFGLFIIQIIALSLLFTLVPFVASLAMFGPEKNECQRCLGASREAKVEPERAAADAEVVEVKHYDWKLRLGVGLTALAIMVIGVAVSLSRAFVAEETQPLHCPAHTEIDFVFEDFDIPVQKDIYRCRGFNHIPVGCVYYVTEMSPLIEPASLTGIVHHMVLSSVTEEVTGCAFTCYDMPAADTILAAWAVGGGSIRWPNGTGFAIHGGYQALQMHYENAALQSGLVDTRSGLRLKLTSKQPDKVLTGLGVGLHPLGSLEIPPGLNSSSWFVDCTPVLLGRITVLAYATHAHKTGTAIVTEIWRNGSVVGDAGSDPHYNFNFQEVKQFPSGQERHLEPGDTLRVICTFNTVGKTKPTVAGYMSENEMCLTYLYAYPANHIGRTSCIQNRAEKLLQR